MRPDLDAPQARCGHLVAYVALCLFGGLRPSEAARLTWDQVNLTDGEIRLKGMQTKTGKGRIVVICKTLKAWLSKYRKAGEIYRSPYDAELKKVRANIGYGPKTEAQPDLNPWVPDVLRHTAISQYFRLTGSYGRTAEQFGNSEGIIKKQYQGRVTSAETKVFYALRPKVAAPRAIITPRPKIPTSPVSVVKRITALENRSQG